MMLIVTFVLSRRGLVTRFASREPEREDPTLEKSERKRRSREFRNFHLDLGRGFVGGRPGRGQLASAGAETELRRHARSSPPKGNLRGSNQFRKLNLKGRNWRLGG